MNRHQKKLYKLARVMYLNQLANNSDFNSSFAIYYKLIKWLYGGSETTEKEIDETLHWARYVNKKSKYKLERNDRNG